MTDTSVNRLVQLCGGCKADVRTQVGVCYCTLWTQNGPDGTAQKAQSLLVQFEIDTTHHPTPTKTIKTPKNHKNQLSNKTHTTVIAPTTQATYGDLFDYVDMHAGGRLRGWGFG